MDERLDKTTVVLEFNTPEDAIKAVDTAVNDSTVKTIRYRP